MPPTEPTAVAPVPASQESQPLPPRQATDSAEERLQPIAQPSPVFPSALIKTLGRGTVRLQFNVMPDGSVDAAEVVSSPHARLNPAALAAVQQWRFQPISRAQQAVVDLAFNVE